MSLEFFLILLVLALGGAIAPLGDRIGTKVGKARLSLFNLRPKKTAVLITILTGIVISASTMGLLLLVSRGIRDRLLNFDKIRRGFQRDVETAQVELEKANTDKSKVEDQLQDFKLERVRVQTQLNRINQSLQGAVARQQKTEALRQRVERQRNQIQSQLTQVSGQALELRSDIGRLERDRQVLVQQRNQVAQQIAQRDREISRRNQLVQQRDQEIKNRDQVINQREQRLKELEQQQVFLQTELTQLAEIAQQSAQLRVGVPAIVRDQTLALAVVQAQGPSQARQAIDVVLGQANRLAVQRIRPGSNVTDQQIIQIERAEIDRLLSRIADGSPYVMRVLAAANYLLGEPLTERRGVRVFIQVVPNRIIFSSNAIVSAQLITNPAERSSDELQEWVTQLINQANFRARQKGVWSNTSTVRFQSVEAVVTQLKQSTTSAEVRIVAAEDTFTAGPLKLEFVVVEAGEVTLRTEQRN
ncbi:DUF3084 domain-containing protein [filamentous cyanobacterium LEGE 11480]|uniref:DUF3084 domain-containing protein n=1 Tax=Romeriopsis navalis LEGE 11480 TaxID=2777977 RepID=A0A928VRA7_9CYAN|nr:DUF3084 domain-containing protein [Romeriopsis navalis]MBE9030704.1 DUF3084 domain-containing protein [Romeriopsis navalis LEGE 11480]